MNISQKKMKQAYDKNAQTSNFKVGDKVFLYVPRVKKGQTQKLTAMWQGPYEIIHKSSPKNFKIRKQGSRNVKCVSHDNLKPYTEPKRTLMSAQPDNQ